MELWRSLYLMSDGGEGSFDEFWAYVGSKGEVCTCGGDSTSLKAVFLEFSGCRPGSKSCVGDGRCVGIRMVWCFGDILGDLLAGPMSSLATMLWFRRKHLSSGKVRVCLYTLGNTDS